MKARDQVIAIAGACGYKLVDCPSSSLGGGEPLRPAPNTYWSESYWADGYIIGLPDYLGDLNACHEMEKVLTMEQREIYYVKLGNIAAHHTPFDYYCDWGVHYAYETAVATAPQRCEAFLRTLNLWTDEPPKP